MLQAAPRQPRKCILRAEMPESDETKTPRPEDDKVKKGRITPEEAKRAQENIKKALNVERVIKFATMCVSYEQGVCTACIACCSFTK